MSRIAYPLNPVDDFEKSFQRIRKIAKARNWPGVEESESWGTPSLKVKGKMLVRVREPGVLVFMCPLEAKEVLFQVAPHIYFELPHYKGYPAILARMEAIEDDEIAEMIEEYWRKVAPKKLLAEFDALPRVEAPQQTKKTSVKKAPTKHLKATTKSQSDRSKILKKSTQKGRSAKP